MSNPVTPLNLTAAALSMLQSRSAAALSAVQSAADAERKLADMVAHASDTLVQQAPNGTAIPRGQILNILV